MTIWGTTATTLVFGIELEKLIVYTEVIVWGGGASMVPAMVG